MLPTVDFNLHAVSEIILLMSKYYQFVVFKVLAAEHSRYDITRLKKSLSKINLNILQWPCIRFLSLTLTFSVKFHIVQSSFIESSSAAF